ncbi:MAG: hypothetical protein ACREQ9_21785 [Candidatus Binatia bacterium]
MPGPLHLSPASAAILRAVIAAIRPRGHGFDQPIDEDVLLEVDRTVPYFPAPLRLAFPLGLRLLEWGPLLFAGRAARMSRMPCAEAAAYLDGWLHSALAPRRMLLLGVRTLVYLAFYQHPSVLAAMEVGWDRRVEETVRLRAATLDHARYGYPR